VSSPHAWPGLEQSEEMVRWLWERQFAGIAGDNPGLEVVREFFFFFFFFSSVSYPFHRCCRVLDIKAGVPYGYVDTGQYN
jgi:hypothetical protein